MGNEKNLQCERGRKKEKKSKLELVWD